jgi:hypothetical protein
MADQLDPTAGKQTSTESTLSTWAGPYVTEMLGRGQAAASTPYQAYTGPLTAGPSTLQNQAFQGLAGLTLPTSAQTMYNPQAFSAEAAQNYMNPYLMSALNPQLEEARRQAEISRVQQAGRMTRAGSFGGGRQAIMESELDRNLMQNLGKITGEGYKSAYDQAMQQFNTEQNRQMAAAKQAGDYGLAALGAQMKGGETERGIASEGITSDIKQFEQERDYPYKQVQFMQSLLQNLPGVASSNYGYQGASGLSEAFGTMSGILGLLKSMGLITGN